MSTAPWQSPMGRGLLVAWLGLHVVSVKLGCQLGHENISVLGAAGALRVQNVRVDESQGEDVAEHGDRPARGRWRQRILFYHVVEETDTAL